MDNKYYDFPFYKWKGKHDPFLRQPFGDNEEYTWVKLVMARKMATAISAYNRHLNLILTLFKN